MQQYRLPEAAQPAYLVRPRGTTSVPTRLAPVRTCGRKSSKAMKTTTFDTAPAATGFFGGALVYGIDHYAW